MFLIKQHAIKICRGVEEISYKLSINTFLIFFLPSASIYCQHKDERLRESHEVFAHIYP
jgi:hypothetical protein